VEQALAELQQAGTPISITAVAAHTGIARATLYRHPDLIALIHEHRDHAGGDLTLTALNSDIMHLRLGIEAVADRVRHHEERLRSLERERRTGTNS
jgi:AcrR family transcriptional regulator